MHLDNHHVFSMGEKTPATGTYEFPGGADLQLRVKDGGTIVAQTLSVTASPEGDGTICVTDLLGIDNSLQDLGPGDVLQIVKVSETEQAVLAELTLTGKASLSFSVGVDDLVVERRWEFCFSDLKLL